MDQDQCFTSSITFADYLAQHPEFAEGWQQDCVLFASKNKLLIGKGVALSLQLDSNSALTATQQVDQLLATAKAQNLPQVVLGNLI